ncbi:MAG: adenosylhomocysteinase [Acidobacteriota bacterium]|nr:adenosylhomocysteinase [Acidobacteriota bacterium]
MTDYELGEKRVDWAFAHMPVVQRIRADYQQRQPFTGLTVAICLHLEPKTANLGLTIKAGGARVVMCPSNPLSTQDSTVAYLQQHLTCYGRRGEDAASYHRHFYETLDHEPDLIIDDGAQLLSTLHKERPAGLDRVIGLSEETTGGVNIIKAIERREGLRFPCIGVNTGLMKHLFDNRHGTGQSTIEGLLAATNLTICGKVVTVAGYGWVGKGVAMRMRGMGAEIIVTEVDAVKALDARMEGYRVMRMIDAAAQSDFIITTTGGLNIVDAPHIAVMKDQCILANVGHFNREINIAALRAVAKDARVVRPDVEELTLSGGRRVYLLANGELVNIAVGQGHPAEIMDMTFALQALSPAYLLERRGQLGPGFYPVPPEIDEQVARLKLDTLAIQIDERSDEQKQYDDYY